MTDRECDICKTPLPSAEVKKYVDCDCGTSFVDGKQEGGVVKERKDESKEPAEVKGTDSVAKEREADEKECEEHSAGEGESDLCDSEGEAGDADNTVPGESGGDLPTGEEE